VRDAYGLRFAGMTPYSPTFMYRALGHELGIPRAILRQQQHRVIPRDRPLRIAQHRQLVREANYRVDRDDAAKESPEAAARWLAKRMGL
jgi:osmoprotectant transport system permease protein